MSECSTCFYCGMPLAKKHEHDHFPFPKRFGGKQIVCACLNCHSLKDRMNLDSWPVESAYKAFTGLTPETKIFVGKVIVIYLELRLFIKKHAKSIKVSENHL